MVSIDYWRNQITPATSSNYSSFMFKYQVITVQTSFMQAPVTLKYRRTHNLRVCLYIAYIACSSASLYI